MLVDYGTGGWNPMAMDLANYLNESMLDNAYPFANGIAVYTDNVLSEFEKRNIANDNKQYHITF